jgi:hypothetical protein
MTPAYEEFRAFLRDLEIEHSLLEVSAAQGNADAAAKLVQHDTAIDAMVKDFFAALESLAHDENPT